MRKKLFNALAFTFALSCLPLTACNNNGGGYGNKLVLRVGSWDEYICEGGEDSYDPGSSPLYEEFAEYYYAKTGKEIVVDYVPLQDNETMYNKVKMGNAYDLLCPSEYMMMKLKAEDRIKPFPQSFFDVTNEDNHYIRNLSPYIKTEFEKGGWLEYIAGYMWGTTGFVFNPDTIGNTPEESREIMSSWTALTHEKCSQKITAKDNVRDSYFMGLGLYYEEELLSLQANNPAEFTRVVNEKMNDTNPETILQVKKHLEKMRGNIYGLETDEGKQDLIAGRLGASYQWSGDAVFILDEAENQSNLCLEYSIPKAASNLWFDGWVLMKETSQEKTEIAMEFINFLSRPENVVRNMYYIGYTSCLSGPTSGENAIYEYIEETYSAEEGDETATTYNLSYFFGPDHILTVPEEQKRRQLFAQYPEGNEDNTKPNRPLVVMRNFDKKTNESLNRMWNNIK